MFPADAGMNRTITLSPRLLVRVPRRRGDEPELEQATGVPSTVFPADAGMNRERTRSVCR